jgi:hypothetical protein
VPCFGLVIVMAAILGLTIAAGVGWSAITCPAQIQDLEQHRSALEGELRTDCWAGGPRRRITSRASAPP